MADVEMTDSEEESAVDKGEELEADSFWQKHLEANKSIIVDSFQGQFKSTVICDVCKHVSITYEPFMYLSVPLPHALERQICKSELILLSFICDSTFSLLLRSHLPAC
jgi:ubiquitin C-terminal hydrolase